MPDSGGTFIGKRVRVIIGGKAPADEPDTVIGQDNTVIVSPAELGRYNRIVGEEVSLTIGGGLDDLVREAVKVLDNTAHPKKKQLLKLAHAILEEREAAPRGGLARQFLAMARDVAPLLSIAASMSQLLGLA